MSGGNSQRILLILVIICNLVNFSQGCKSKTTPAPPREGDYLFLGPGTGSSGHSEVLHLPSLETTQCRVPVHPKGDVMQGYVGTLTAQGPVLCGGWYQEPGGHYYSTEECYLLSKSDGTWTKMNSSMNKKASRAAGVVLDSGEWWVTGGNEDGRTHATTELWYNSTWSYSDPLPTPLSHHCMLQYNSTHTFLSGGWNGWYSKDGGYVPVVGMGTGRRSHGCTVDTTGLIYVAGGWNSVVSRSGMLNSVEIFSPSSAQWYYGPDLPVATERGVMLTEKNDILFIGGRDNKKIWSLVKTDGEPTGWKEVGEMKQYRAFFSAITLKMAGCENWKV